MLTTLIKVNEIKQYVKTYTQIIWNLEDVTKLFFIGIYLLSTTIKFSQIFNVSCNKILIVLKFQIILKHNHICFERRLSVYFSISSMLSNILG